MSHAVAESASGVGVAKFILIFYPTWSLWSEFRNFVNASGTDDVLQRLAVLWLMALLIGYTANASAIKLGSPESTKAATTISTQLLDPLHMTQKIVEERTQLKDLELSRINTSLTGPSQTPESTWGTTSLHIPATNIEHFVERTALFVVIVLGEIVLSVVYIASDSQTGVSSVYGTAYAICLLLSTSAGFTSMLNVAERFTSVTYTNLHFPLCASLIIVAAATYKMTQHPNKITPAIGWYFSGGLGVALVSLALIEVTHRELDPKGTTRLGRLAQLGCRIAVGLIIFCLPLTTDATALFMLGNSAGLISLLVIGETYGKLRRVEPIAKPNILEQDSMNSAVRDTEGGTTR
ncbi:hypothetical protein FRC06_001589, partial [Ceratobasidium sp. 370]